MPSLIEINIKIITDRKSQKFVDERALNNFEGWLETEGAAVALLY